MQNQNFNDIEIIFIDDDSKDNAIELIKNNQKKDHRIILLRNKKNKGTFVSRNLGLIYSSGKYVILPDPDDIISKDILSICFKYSEKYNYDIIKFNNYIGNHKLSFQNIIKNQNSVSIFQPFLSTYIFYGNDKLELIDYNINNKFIKKDIYLKSLNSFNKYYLNIYIIYMEDQMINYIIYRYAKSFYNLNKIGYFYITNTNSITRNDYKISQLKMKFIFIYLKFVFEFSKNQKYEKDMCNFLLSYLSKKYKIVKMISQLFGVNELKFYNDIINQYSKNTFITKGNKYLLKDLKKILNKKIK